ncbi:MAG: DMT family transporter [Deltaproteobacteria bacterium]|nr:DMT family transporter [Deltaproteobacteria bacterium]
MSRSTAHTILFVGLFLVSTSGPVLRMAQMDAFAVVLYRMGFSGVLFLLWALIRRERMPTRAELSRVALGAAFLAAHFCLWIKAFDLTNYASNLLLLVTEPVTAAVFGVWLGERPNANTWMSVALSIVGLAIVAGGDFALGSRALLGDGFCVLGGVAITLFFAVTRNERNTLSLSSFMGWTMAVGALCALPIVLLARSPLLAYPPASWGWMAALVVLTTVGGHGAFNIAARHVTLFTVNVVVVLEPAIAIAMGAGLFGATVTSLQVVGGLILAVAVVVGLRAPAGAHAQAMPSE